MRTLSIGQTFRALLGGSSTPRTPVPYTRGGELSYVGDHDDGSFDPLLDIEYKASETIAAIAAGGSGTQSRIKELDFVKLQDLYGRATWVYVAIERISKALSQVPIIAINKNSPNPRAKRNTKLLQLIEQPNPFQTRCDFMDTMAVYLKTTGNIFIEKADMDGQFRPQGLYPLNPRYMAIIPDAKRKVAGYIYFLNGKKIPFLPNEVIHIQYPNPYNDFWGMGPLAAAQLPANTDIKASEWESRFFDNSARPDIVLKTEKSLNTDEFRRLKAEWNREYRGYKKAHRAALLENGLSVEKISLTQNDIDFLNGRRLNREEILAIFGVPPVVAGVFEFCLEYRSLVATKQGPKQIKDVEVGDTVYSYTKGGLEEAKVTKTFAPRKQETFKLRTSGREIEASGNHPFLTAVFEEVEKVFYGQLSRKVKRWKLVWRRMDRLVRGDFVVLADRLPEGVREEVQERQLTKEFMEVCGAYIGDGTLCKVPKTNRFASVSIALHQEDAHRSYYATILPKFWKRADPKKQHIPPKVTLLPNQLQLNSVLAANELSGLGFGGKSTERRVPKWVFECTDELKLAFLRGLVDTDGCAQKNGWLAFNLSNEGLTNDIRALCMSLGLRVTNVSYSHYSTNYADDCEMWTFTVTYGMEKIGSNDPEKQRRIDRSKCKAHKQTPTRQPSMRYLGLPPDVRVMPIRSVKKTGEVAETYDIEVEGHHNFVAEGMVVHNSNTTSRSAGVREQTEIFWVNTIMPDMGKILGTLNKELAPFFSSNQVLIGDWSGVPALKEDEERKLRRAQAYAALVQNGVPPNVALQRMYPEAGMTVEGGDVGYLPNTMVPIAALAKISDASVSQSASNNSGGGVKEEAQ